MKLKYLISLAGGMALLAGCATNKEIGSEMRDPGDIPLVFRQPTVAYRELGTFATPKVQPDRSITWQQVLREQGAMRGADAVYVDTHTLNNSTTPMVAGTAIRYVQ